MQRVLQNVTRSVWPELTVETNLSLSLSLRENGEDFRSDVALDDLSIEQGYCPGT